MSPAVVEVELERESIAGLPGDERARAGTGRAAKAVSARFEMWSSASGHRWGARQRFAIQLPRRQEGGLTARHAGAQDRPGERRGPPAKLLHS